MKSYTFAMILFFITVASSACFAGDKTYRIEVLQVTNIEPYQKSYEGFLKVLRIMASLRGRTSPSIVPSSTSI